MVVTTAATHAAGNDQAVLCRTEDLLLDRLHYHFLFFFGLAVKYGEKRF